RPPRLRDRGGPGGADGAGGGPRRQEVSSEPPEDRSESSRPTAELGARERRDSASKHRPLRVPIDEVPRRSTVSDLAPRGAASEAEAEAVSVPRPGRLPEAPDADAPPTLPPEEFAEASDDDDLESYELLVEDPTDPEVEELEEALEEEVRQSRVSSLPPADEGERESYVSSLPPAEPSLSALGTLPPAAAEELLDDDEAVDEAAAAPEAGAEAPAAQGEGEGNPALTESDEIELVDDEILHD